jgi:hypothetical protein
VNRDQDVVYKIFNLNQEEIDEFNNTPSSYFQRECKCYRLLNNETYLSQDGRRMSLVPRCLEIGQNYLKLERYQTSMVAEITDGGLFEQYKSLVHVVDNYVIPMASRLDQLGFCHNDFHPRNIVLDYDLKRCSVIDFGLVSIGADDNTDHRTTWTGIEYFLDYMDMTLFIQN